MISTGAAERVARDLLVQPRRVRAQLEHRRRAPRRAGGPCPRPRAVERRAHRRRARVVRVVDHRDALPMRSTITRIGGSRHRGDPARRIGHRDARTRARRRCASIALRRLCAPRSGGLTVTPSISIVPSTRRVDRSSAPRARRRVEPRCTTRRARPFAASATSGCDAGTMATRRRRRRGLSSRITPSISPAPRGAPPPIDVTTTMSGADDRAQARHLAGHVHRPSPPPPRPQSSGIASSVSGTPTRLLKLPLVACTSSRAPSAARGSSFVVVLPSPPHDADHRTAPRAAADCASAPSARSVSRTTNAGTPTVRPRLGGRPRTAAAPVATAPREELVRVELLAAERDETVAGARARACRWRSRAPSAAPFGLALRRQLPRQRRADPVERPEPAVAVTRPLP